MKPWAGALVWPFLLGITSGYDLRMASRLSNNFFMSEKASLSAGECLSSPNTINIPAGDFAVFTSPNWPRHFGAYQHCSWNFKTDADAQLWLSCESVEMSWFSLLYVVDQGTRHETCMLSGKYKYMIRSNTATVGLQNNFVFTNKGFWCRISSFRKPNNAGCSCGVSNSKRIIGGAETAPNEYPWMVVVIRGFQRVCGGSLITDEFVLTAARCTNEGTTYSYDVLLGFHDKYNSVANTFRREVLQIIQHPSYHSFNKDYDVSLLRISALDFNSNPKIRPICLPAGSNTYAGQQAITAGWGSTTNFEGLTSSVLLDVTVPVLSNSACNILYHNKVTNSMICAGSTGLGFCQDDFGGPLFLSGGSGYQVIIGIVSWSNGCGDAGYPGVYTRTTVVKSWIDSQLNGSTVCPPP